MNALMGVVRAPVYGDVSWILIRGLLKVDVVGVPIAVGLCGGWLLLVNESSG